MNIAISLPEGFEGWPEVRPFVLVRDHVLPVLEEYRPRFEAMYDAKWGRPEIDPVLLAAFTVLQMLQRVPDRAAVENCTYDVRWRMALNLPPNWVDFHPTTLVHFRRRLAKHGGARWAMDAGLEAMRRAGYLKGNRAIRIDSTHVLGWVAAMSRLECVRETLRLALDFLAAFGGAEAWMPWAEQYAQRRPEALRHASAVRLHATMAQAGLDTHAVLERAAALGPAVVDAEPVALLRRVFHEQFETLADAGPSARHTTPPQSVHNPHDPDAAWSTKKTLNPAGWVGYKVQVCETAAETPCARGEPTSAVITAVVTQTATASDQNSLPLVLAHHVETGQPPADTVFTDAGYINANQLEAAEAAGFELCGPVGAPPHSGARFGSDAFDVDLPNRRAVCPGGHASIECSRIAESRGITCYYFAWARAACAACPLANQCLSKRKRSPIRTLQVGDRHMIVQARRRLCQTPAYRRRMDRRNGIEGSISELKRGHGIRRCRYRGRPRTDVQMQFAAASCNLRRWAARLAWLARQRA